MRKAAMNAAVLIAVISALIILYILFLPSQDRLDIIGENASNRDFGPRTEDVLLEDSSVLMEHFSEDEIDHTLPSLTLYSTTTATVLKDVASFYVKKSLFGEQTRDIDFSLRDTAQAENTLLSFSVKKSKGDLIIELNGKLLWAGPIEKVNADPIRVQKDALSTDNTLTFKVSNPGIAFWRTNEYLIENFKVTSDIVDSSSQRARVDFVLGKEEAGNIEKATLRFLPECENNRIGVLDILVNERAIYSSVPDCGVPRPLQFDSKLLIEGQNTLEFKSAKGRYLIDQIKVTTNLKDIPSFTYYFDIDSDQLRDINARRKSANFTMFFTDDREDKAAEIVINGRKTFMTRHDEFEWSLILDRYLEPGSNSLKIIPDTRLEVRRLQVVLDDQ
ncbi:MAG: hypothetical protein Q7S65_04340 [Nanoarchaeota archaeon]|nr:hypothetical protein [Nanoarchaeota archaeon]